MSRSREEHEVAGTVWFCRCPQHSRSRGGLARPGSGHNPGLTHLLAHVKWWISLDFGNHRQEQHSTVLACKNHIQKAGRLCPPPKTSLASIVCHTAKIYSRTTDLDIKESLWLTFSWTGVEKSLFTEAEGKAFHTWGNYWRLQLPNLENVRSPQNIEQAKKTNIHIAQIASQINFYIKKKSFQAQ